MGASLQYTQDIRRIAGRLPLYRQRPGTPGCLIAFTDWMIDITSGLSDQQIQDMLRSEHGGLNETFADVAAITGDKKYLELARRFSIRLSLIRLSKIKTTDRHARQHPNTESDRLQTNRRTFTGRQNWNHAEEWDHAARFFWNTVATIALSVSEGIVYASISTRPIILPP